MNQVYVVAARRTPILRSARQYSQVGAERLAATVIDALLQETGVPPGEVNQVLLGSAAGPGGNIARVATLASSLGPDVPATSFDAQCASGLEAIAAGARMIACGEARVVIAGGTESVSTAPWRLSNPHDPMEPVRRYSRARFTPAPDPDPGMGVAAENIARRYGISRERQDRFALRSHHRALAAQQAGHFTGELVPVGTPQGVVTRDGCPRSNLSMEKLSALRPAFVAGGSVTAGNSCPINDGAAAVMLVDAETLGRLRVGFALRYLGAAAGACDPQVLGMAAVPAYRNLQRLLPQLLQAPPPLLEFNEAFAVQALACLDELEVAEACVNLEGGALALGHPYGASGGILVSRLFWQARRRGLHGANAVALMAAAGGTGSAVAFEALVLQGPAVA